MKKITIIILTFILSIVLFGCKDDTTSLTNITTTTKNDTTSTTTINNDTTTSTDETTTTTNEITTTTEDITTTTTELVTKYPKWNKITEDVKLLSLDVVLNNHFKMPYPPRAYGWIFKTRENCGIVKYDSIDRVDNFSDFGEYLKESAYDDFFDTYNIMLIIYPHSSSITGFNYTGYKIIDNNTFCNIFEADLPGGDTDWVNTYFLFAINKKYDIKNHTAEVIDTTPETASEEFPLYLYTLDPIFTMVDCG